MKKVILLVLLSAVGYIFYEKLNNNTLRPMQPVIDPTWNQSYLHSSNNQGMIHKTPQEITQSLVIKSAGLTNDMVKGLYDILNKK